ncbi:MAG: hypothetical protein JW723_02695 [Bacteroidales bacterium]|jgi:hypothetical protein|nr:hypothetical protein [Bacteroidales bacterium]
MDNALKKTVAYILIGLVLTFTVLAILGIWEVINLDYILKKIVLSLLVVFAASAVILFVFSILIRDNEPPKKLE